MRVALDATPLTLSSGGLRRYTSELSMALAAEFPNDVYTLMSDQTFTMPEGSANLCAAIPPSTLLDRKWWLIGASRAMRRNGSQIFHGTNFEVPYVRCRPAVMTIHDLSPWRNREWHHAAARVRKRTPWLLRMGAATMVITPSQAVRKEVIERFRLAPERVVATPLGPARLTTAPATPADSRPYFLFVGTLEPRKNLGMLLTAWRAVRKLHEVDLIIAGRRREDGPVLVAEPGLRLLGEVRDQELAGLYGNALAFVYPSHYEGFGLPVIEAMQHGAAVVVSGDPALLEVAGSAALEANSAEELATILEALITRPELRREYRDKAVQRARHFDWRNTARATHAVYEEAIARFR